MGNYKLNMEGTYGRSNMGGNSFGGNSQYD